MCFLHILTQHCLIFAQIKLRDVVKQMLKMYKPEQRNPRLQIIGNNQHSYVQLVQMSILIYRIQQVARRSLLESRNI